MDHQILTLPIIFTFMIFIFMIFKRSKIFKINHETQNLPPGPKKLPLIGNIHHLAGALPHHRLRDLSNKYGPLMHLQLGEISTVVVSSPETAKEVMKTHDLIFSGRPFVLAADTISYNSTGIALTPYGDYWKQVRKICITELLSSKRVKSFRSIREEEVQNLINSINSDMTNATTQIPNQNVINLSKKIFSSTYGITARAAFGRKCKDEEKIIGCVMKGIEIAGGFSVGELFPSMKFLHLVSGMRGKIEMIHQETDRILVSIIDEHKKRRVFEDRDDDLLDVLLNVREHGDLEFPLTIDNIKAVLLDIISAGSETSSTTVEWAISEMLKNPTIMKKAQTEVRQVFSTKKTVDEEGLNDLKFLKLIIKETLRLHPPAPLLVPRETREKCEINSYNIPIKTQVLVNSWAIGRDPKYWIEPEKFWPERFLDNSIDYKGNNFEYIPFGGGRRICPGISFGIANVELPLANLLFHFDWKFPNGMKNEDLAMIEKFGATVRRANDLYLIPIPYQ